MMLPQAKENEFPSSRASWDLCEIRFMWNLRKGHLFKHPSFTMSLSSTPSFSRICRKSFRSRLMLVSTVIVVAPASAKASAREKQSMSARTEALISRFGQVWRACSMRKGLANVTASMPCCSCMSRMNPIWRLRVSSAYQSPPSHVEFIVTSTRMPASRMMLTTPTNSSRVVTFPTRPEPVMACGAFR